MWTFLEVVRIMHSWNAWEGLATLVLDGVPSSYHFHFNELPTAALVEQEATKLMTRMNDAIIEAELEALLGS